MLCKKCGENEKHSYKGRQFELCVDCILAAFSELFDELDMQRGLTTHEAVKPHIPSSDSKPCSDCGEIGGHKWTCPQF